MTLCWSQHNVAQIFIYPHSFVYFHESKEFNGRDNINILKLSFYHADFKNFNYDTIIDSNVEIVEINDCINLDQVKIVKFLSQFKNVKELELKQLELNYIDSLIIYFKSLYFLNINFIGLKEFPYSIACLDKLERLKIFDNFVFNKKKIIKKNLSITNFTTYSDSCLNDLLTYFSLFNNSLGYLRILSDTLTSLPKVIKNFTSLKFLFVFSPILKTVNLDYITNLDRKYKSVRIALETWDVPNIKNYEFRNDVSFQINYVKDEFNRLIILKNNENNYIQKECGLSFKPCETPYKAKFHRQIAGLIDYEIYSPNQIKHLRKFDK